jgi:hypothetical protein
MLKYRPGYYLVTTAGDYEFIAYMRKQFKTLPAPPKGV